MHIYIYIYIYIYTRIYAYKNIFHTKRWFGTNVCQCTYIHTYTHIPHSETCRSRTHMPCQKMYECLHACSCAHIHTCAYDAWLVDERRKDFGTDKPQTTDSDSSYPPTSNSPKSKPALTSTASRSNFTDRPIIESNGRKGTLPTYFLASWQTKEQSHGMYWRKHAGRIPSWQLEERSHGLYCRKHADCFYNIPAFWEPCLWQAFKSKHEHRLLATTRNNM